MCAHKLVVKLSSWLDVMGMLPCAMQAVYVVHKTRSAVVLADMEAPSTVTVRLINYTPSDVHIRQLKSSTIGVFVEQQQRQQQ